MDELVRSLFLIVGSPLPESSSCIPSILERTTEVEAISRPGELLLFIDLDLDVKFVTLGHVAYRCTCRIGYVRYQIIFECNGWGHLIS